MEWGVMKRAMALWHGGAGVGSTCGMGCVHVEIERKRRKKQKNGDSSLYFMTAIKQE